MQAWQLEVQFLAAIPVGHEVVVQQLETPGFFSGWSDVGAVLLDRTSGILWAPALDHINDRGPLTPEHFLSGSFGAGLRQKPGTTPFVGRVVACLVSTRGKGAPNHIITSLTLEPVAGAYR